MGTRFPIPDGARLRVSSISGSVKVIAEDRPDLDVKPSGRHMEVSDDGRVVNIKSASTSLEVRCPRGLDVSAGTISGSVELIGDFGSVKAASVSGRVQLDSASGDVDIRSVSGSLKVESCGGRCSLNTKSGSISVGRVAGAISASSISGSVEVETAGQEDVEVKSVSGTLVVRVSEERQPRVRMRSISGRVKCDCPEGSDFEIRANTISGSLEVKKS